MRRRHLVRSLAAAAAGCAALGAAVSAQAAPLPPAQAAQIEAITLAARATRTPPGASPSPTRRRASSLYGKNPQQMFTPGSS